MKLMRLGTNIHAVSATGSLDNRLPIQKNPSHVMGKRFPASIHPIMTLSNWSLVANTIRGTVSSWPLAAISFIHAYVAMMR